MALTDTAIRNAKPKTMPYKVADSQGLYLLVNPGGSKLWRCSAPRKLDRFSLEFPVVWNLAGRRQKDASIEVHGRAEGVHYQAG